MPADALRRWMRQWPEPLGLRAVEVTGLSVEAEATDRGELAIVSPDGFRFEGVDLDTAVWLYRSLR